MIDPRDLEELFRVVDRLRGQVGDAAPLPSEPGGYRVVGKGHYLLAYQEPDGTWYLNGKEISREGLRRYLETYSLNLMKYPEDD